MLVTPMAHTVTVIGATEDLVMKIIHSMREVPTRSESRSWLSISSKIELIIYKNHIFSQHVNAATYL